MNTRLTSESPKRMCLAHPERPALFTRVEQRTKPILQTVRIPECQECADRIRKIGGATGIVTTTVRKV